nr:hypothetical protein CFP56_70249 [Quercus suber]
MPTRRSHPVIATLLVLAKPRLLRLAQNPLGAVIDKVSDHDQTKRDRVQIMYVVAKHLGADDDAPEIAGQETDVEESGGGHAEDQRGGGVEPSQDEGVAGEVAADVVVPDVIGVIGAVKDGALDADDQHTPEGQLAEDLVDGTFADEELLKDVGEPISSRADEREQVALNGVGRLPAVRARDVVRGHQDAEPAAAHQDANVLRDVVADFQEDQRDEDDDGDGPEVDELRGEDGGVLVSVDGEVVTLNVAEGEDEVAPAVLPHEPAPALEAVAHDRGGGVDERQQDVGEQRLESRVDGAFLVQEGRQRARARVADGQDLRQRQHEPELLRLEIPEFTALALHLGHRRPQRRLFCRIRPDHVHDAVPAMAGRRPRRAVEVERRRRSFGPHGLDVHRVLLDLRHGAQRFSVTREKEKTSAVSVTIPLGRTQALALQKTPLEEQRCQDKQIYPLKEEDEEGGNRAERLSSE